MSRPKTRRLDSQQDHTTIPLHEINREWWPAFQGFSPDRNGEISLGLVKQRLAMAEGDHGISEAGIAALVDRADKDHNGKLNYEEFVDLVRGKEYAELQRPLIRRALRAAAFSVIPRHMRDEYGRQYADEYSCTRHPPLFMLAISFIELGIFIYHVVKMSNKGIAIGANGPAPVDSRLIYNPYRRYEAWRFVSYMFVHAGYTHIIFNILVQLMLGIPLELVHKWWRILVVYFAGVVAGSLGTSITDPGVYLAGASGGVYALIAAHLASVVLNWSEMEFAWFRVVAFAIIVSTDVGVAVYYRYVGFETKVGYAAHFAGAVAGLLVGVVVLRNLRQLQWEKIVSWVCLSVFVVLMIAGIAWNAVYTEHFPVSKYD